MADSRQRAVDGNVNAYDLALTQYEVGKIDLLSILQMQTRWIGARVGLARLPVLGNAKTGANSTIPISMRNEYRVPASLHQIS